MAQVTTPDFQKHKKHLGIKISWLCFSYTFTTIKYRVDRLNVPFVQHETLYVLINQYITQQREKI